jgi:purine catabolism regulator
VLRRALPQVLAGRESLGRIVRWVHVVDVPDPDELLRGGELVLSTGLGPGPTDAGQRRFIRSLCGQDAAGLLIEVGYSYKRELPRALIAEAESRGLPLIATHRPTRFVDITEAIHAALLDRGLALLRRVQGAGERLTALVLARAELGELLAELARTLRNPVVLENLAGQPLSFATYESGERELLEAHLEYRRARDPGALSGPGWLAVEISTGGHPWGQLTALELDSPLADDERAVLERGAEAVALSLLGEQHGEHLRDRARGTFLAELRQGRVSEADAARRAHALEFRAGRGPLLAGALRWRSERWSEFGATPAEAMAALLPALRPTSRERALLLGPDGDALLLVARLGEREPSEQQLDALAAELRAPLRRRGIGEEELTLVLAGAERSWSATGRRLERGAAAALAAKARPPAAWHDARRATLVDLLYALRGSPELLAFTREQLEPLFGERDQRRRELLRTLEAFLQSGGHKAQTARALHVTRQSLYLRLERIEQLLGVDLDEPDTRLALHLALRCKRLTDRLAPEERR